MNIQHSQTSTIIYLVRHGQSEWNNTKRVSGQCNPPLSPKGLKKSLVLQEVLGHEMLTAIYTSTLHRAVQTASPTAEAHHLPIQMKEELKEIHFGSLQGRFRDHRDPEAYRLWLEREKDPHHFRAPGGETFCELTARVIPCLEEILRREAGGRILIVGHRSTNRVLLGFLMQWQKERWVQLDFTTKYLYQVTYGPEQRIRTISLGKRNLGHTYDTFII